MNGGRESLDQDKDPPSPLSRGCRFDSFFLQRANEPVTEPWADQVSHHERHKDSWSVEREQGKVGGGEGEEWVERGRNVKGGYGLESDGCLVQTITAVWACVLSSHSFKAALLQLRTFDHSLYLYFFLLVLCVCVVNQLIIILHYFLLLFLVSLLLLAFSCYLTVPCLCIKILRKKKAAADEVCYSLKCILCSK